ncbi:Doublesex and mab-3-related transcription factor 3 [Gossypium australe]|uniref:Doublesex and mab-3-related transcription factor 3 n=1 Tax=Gossypium australe TaxID=47621 RepID=A0A5B6WYS9_9ROSI|nr:Doublesex and mab-3-related transcription factor 3 [Gossypium australe]
MSAIVSGKRSFFEELSSTPPASKRIRCSSRFTSSFSPSSSPQSPPSFLIDHLISIFPHMDKQVLERALEECGDDLDSAIRSLNELCLGSADRNAAAADKTGVELEGNVQIQTRGITANGDVPTKEQTSPEAFSMDGSDWVELFVREMLNASNIDDARARASRALEVFEKSIHAPAGAEVAQNLHQENMMLKEQLETLIQENTILKRAVAVQHERQKEYENQSQELQHLKQVISQYQEQLRTLEINNYALTVHLKQAQQSSNIPGRFNPDVF